MPHIRKWIVLATVTLLTQEARAVDIVLDPTNLQVNLEQVAHHLEEIARFDEQIRNQLRMLENWEFTRLDELLASMQNISTGLEGVTAVDLPGLYPIAAEAYADRSAKAMQDLRRQWLESQHAAVVQARTVQDQVVGEMPGNQQRVGEYLEHSGEASGQTAVLQASNETLATLAAQLQNLQALELTETRVELEEEARRQAEAAFCRQRRAALMRDWASGDPFESVGRGPVAPPFVNH